MGHPKYQLLAIISGILTILGFSNLIINVHTTKNTKHLTFIWLFLIFLSQILLIVYGILNNIHVIYFQALILVIGLLYILYVKLKYEVNNDVETELKIKDII